MLRTRRVLVIGVVLALGLVATDTGRRLARPHATALALQAIHGYQRTLAPWLSALGWRCRFVPTCSQYAEAAIRTLGVARGSWQAVRRIARCGPWTSAGTVDPPPHRNSRQNPS